MANYITNREYINKLFLALSVEIVLYHKRVRPNLLIINKLYIVYQFKTNQDGCFE